jgi:hypothetical protein
LSSIFKLIPSIDNSHLVILIKVIKVLSIFCNSKLAWFNILSLKVYL